MRGPQRIRADSPRDQRMLVAESDSYAGAIGRPDRDDQIVAEGLVRLGHERTTPSVANQQPDALQKQ